MRTQIKILVSSFAVSWLPLGFLHLHHDQAWTPLLWIETMEFFALSYPRFPLVDVLLSLALGNLPYFPGLYDSGRSCSILYSSYTHANPSQVLFFSSSERDDYTHVIYSRCPYHHVIKSRHPISDLEATSDCKVQVPGFETLTLHNTLTTSCVPRQPPGFNAVSPGYVTSCFWVSS